MKRISDITHKLFYDNKVLMVFSFVLAIIIWLVVVISLSPIDNVIIKDVPVTIDLANSVPAQFDLEVFGQTEFTVDVEVSGKRYILASSANPNSVKVVAQTSYVDSAGKHTLALKASKMNDADEFEILSVSDDFIEVFFDTYTEQEFVLEPKINVDGELVKNGYIAGDVKLSSEKVTVSGPTTEVVNIAKVCAEMTVDEPLDQTQTQTADIKAYSKSGATMHYLSYNYDNSDITISIPIYYVVTKPASVSFSNTPIEYIDSQFSYTVSPSVISAGVQGANENNLPNTISVATIDFSKLMPGVNRFTFFSDSIPSVISVDSVREYKVTVNVTGCTTKTLAVKSENINHVNLPDGYEYSDVEKPIGAVTIVGPQESLDNITALDLIAVVDFSNADFEKDSQEFPVKVSIKNSEDCWVVGEYTITYRK